MHPNVVDDRESIDAILASARRIAVLGIKTEAQADAAAFYVPRDLAEMGYDIVPVPVYYPDVTEILGRPVLRRVADVPKPVDIVSVFRRTQDLMPHLADLLAARPGCVWLQSGIKDDRFADVLAATGIKVVQDRCILVEVKIRAALRRRGE